MSSWGSERWMRIGVGRNLLAAPHDRDTAAGGRSQLDHVGAATRPQIVEQLGPTRPLEPEVVIASLATHERTKDGHRCSSNGCRNERSIPSGHRLQRCGADDPRAVNSQHPRWLRYG